MNKNELERRLEAAEKQMIGLQDEIQNLKAKLADVQDEPDIPDFPVVKKCGDELWYMNSFLRIVSSVSSEGEKSDYNLFHAEEYAQEFANKCKLIAMMLHCKWYIERDALDTSEEIWTYGICYNKAEKKFILNLCCLYEPCAITFKNEEAAQKCADWLNDHWKENENG